VATSTSPMIPLVMIYTLGKFQAIGVTAGSTMTGRRLSMVSHILGLKTVVIRVLVDLQSLTFQST